MAEEKEMAGDTVGDLQTWSEADMSSGTQPVTTRPTSEEENEAWAEWQEDIRNDEDSDHAEDISGSKSSTVDRTAPNRVRNTRNAPKQKIRIATFFNKHTHTQNKRKRRVTLEEVIGDTSESTDEDSDNNTTPERTQQPLPPRPY